MSDITVAISTFGTRGLRLSTRLLPKTDGVRFLIVQQMPQGAEQSAQIDAHIAMNLQRADIRVILSDKKGVAISRNIALAATETELLLFADDDMKFCPDGWREMRQWFAENPRCDVLCGRLRAPDGGWRKSYGAAGRAVTRFNCLKVGTPEIALRATSIRKAGPGFSPDFGAGAGYPIGDEYLFLTDCLKAGLTGRHVAVCFGVHGRDSSGTAFDKAALGARTELFHRVFGRWSGLIRIAFAIKQTRRFDSLRDALLFALRRDPGLASSVKLKI